MFTPVLAKHSKNFSIEDSFAIGVNRIQGNFEPLKRQIEAWKGRRLFTAVAKLPESAMTPPALVLEPEPTVYDAAYLELALRLGLPMGTKDKALKRAMANSGVKLVEP